MKRFSGIAAAPGITAGPAFIYAPEDLSVRRKNSADPDGEWRRYQEAAKTALKDLVALRQKAALEVGEGDAAIFDAHQMMIKDPEMEIDLQAEINAGASAEFAVEKIYAQEVATFEAMEDPYFRERAMDYADVGQRLLRLLLGVQERSLAELNRPVIVVAQDLMPSDTALMDKSLVRGFCTSRGGPLSHTAILACNLGLPAVVGIGPDLMALREEDWLIVDGTSGVVIANADESERATYQKRAEAAADAKARAVAVCQEPAITLDGQRVEVVANIGLPGEEVAALEAGAEGIGLLRTEFLFVDRQTPPTEEEQLSAYRPILETLDQRPLIARTLDIGGDKPAAYLSVPLEENPFLGWRAIRICLDQPDLLKTQLRSLLRAGAGHNLKIMFPMVATVTEMKAARELFNEVRSELEKQNVQRAEKVEVGTMIEVPSAALMADHMIPYIDFFSIGSNDLTQYTLAADRGNPGVASIFDSLDPAVLRLINNVITVAHENGKWVGLCGEMAGDPMAIPILLGLGLDEFSIGTAAIPMSKSLIRKLSLFEAGQLAKEALAQPTASTVRSLIREWMAERNLRGSVV